MIVVKKDTRLPKHSELAVPNLEVMNVMKSLKSRGYVTEQFSWQFHYFYVTDEGILFLRNYLHMPEHVVPATIAKGAAAAAAAATSTRAMGARLEDKSAAPREDYRRGGYRAKTEQTA